MKKLLSLFLILSLLLCGCSVEIVLGPEETAAPTDSGENTLAVHFIDVGQADCALIECGGAFVLIDGGNRDDGQKVVSYLQSCGVEELEAVIKEEVAADCPSVVICRRPCALLKTVKKNPPMKIDPDKCKGCRACMKIGCPCISFADKKAKIDASTCVGCGLCAQMCKFGAIE